MKSKQHIAKPLEAKKYPQGNFIKIDGNYFPYKNIDLKTLQVVKSALLKGCAIFPTETLYALGCSTGSQAGVDRVFAVKSRSAIKPLPVVCADMKQVSAHFHEHKWLEKIAADFWPGPLSMLLKPKTAMARGIASEQGMVACRIPANPLTRSLCLWADSPLVATSANQSTLPGVHSPDKLEEQITSQADLVITGNPGPGGGLPSTLISVSEDGEVEILRSGAVPASKLNFENKMP